MPITQKIWSIIQTKAVGLSTFIGIAITPAWAEASQGTCIARLQFFFGQSSKIFDNRISQLTLETTEAFNNRMLELRAFVIAHQALKRANQEALKSALYFGQDNEGSQIKTLHDLFLKRQPNQDELNVFSQMIDDALQSLVEKKEDVVALRKHWEMSASPDDDLAALRYFLQQDLKRIPPGLDRATSRMMDLRGLASRLRAP